MNIGIIIRNDHDDTFPVALTPQMVSIIQNLLTQLPAAQSKLVDSSGKKVASNASIPIIPRLMEFDWDTAYAPIMPEEEQKMMKALQDKYAEDEKNCYLQRTEASDAAKTGGIIVPEGMNKDEDDPDGKVTKLKKPAMFTDKDNPFNLSLDAKGRANVDLEKTGSDTEPDPNVDDKVSIGSDKEEEIRADEAETAGAEPPADQAKAAEGESSEDCTVTPESLNLSGEQKNI
jgi:hypothetical protein